MSVLLGTLASSGLSLLASAAKNKGIEFIQDYVKEKTGIALDLNQGSITDEQAETLQKMEAANQEELQRIALEKYKIEADIAKTEIEESTKQIEAVNASMQSENKSTEPWAAKWRPFWGFTSAIAFIVYIVGLVVIVGIAVYNKDVSMLKEIPSLVFAISVLFGIPASILGVASWHRGVMQRIQAGEQPQPGLVGSIAERIRGGGR